MFARISRICTNIIIYNISWHTQGKMASEKQVIIPLSSSSSFEFEGKWLLDNDQSEHIDKFISFFHTDVVHFTLEISSVSDINGEIDGFTWKYNINSPNVTRKTPRKEIKVVSDQKVN